MKAFFVTLMLMLAVAHPARAQSIVGDWQGTIKAGPAELRVVLHVTQNASGLAATLDSPDQAARGIAVSSIAVTGDTVKFESAQIMASYEGTLSAAGIRGTWSQLGMSTSLDWTKAAPASTRPRVVKPSDIDGDWEGAIGGG